MKIEKWMPDMEMNVQTGAMVKSVGDLWFFCKGLEQLYSKTLLQADCSFGGRYYQKKRFNKEARLFIFYGVKSSLLIENIVCSI